MGARVLIIALIATVIIMRIFRGKKITKFFKEIIFGWFIAFVALLIVFNLAVYIFN